MIKTPREETSGSAQQPRASNEPTVSNIANAQPTCKGDQPHPKIKVQTLNVDATRANKDLACPSKETHVPEIKKTDVALSILGNAGLHLLTAMLAERVRDSKSGFIRRKIASLDR